MMTATSQSIAPMCNLAAIVEAMMRPEMYPDHPRSVEVRQTHVSYVFIAGDYVYKIKKPVRFAFLDARTLARRSSALSLASMKRAVIVDAAADLGTAYEQSVTAMNTALGQADFRRGVGIFDWCGHRIASSIRLMQ